MLRNFTSAMMGRKSRALYKENPINNCGLSLQKPSTAQIQLAVICLCPVSALSLQGCLMCFFFLSPWWWSHADLLLAMVCHSAKWSQQVQVNGDEKIRAAQVSLKEVKANPEVSGETEGQDFPFVLGFSWALHPLTSESFWKFDSSESWSASECKVTQKEWQRAGSALVSVCTPDLSHP